MMFGTLLTYYKSMRNGYVSTYRYDDAGNRTVKFSGNGNAVFVCVSDSSNGFTQTNRFTAYPNPYMVYNGSKYFKHIYVGSERIVSKVSVNNPDYDPRQKDCAGNEITGYNVKLHSQHKALSDSIASIYAKFEVPYFGSNNDTYSYNWQDGIRRVAAANQEPDSYGELAYYYHSDHLGSTSYVTDANGAVSQHVEYVPFGEIFIEELSSSAKLNTPFLFNGKELDEETGLYYYGARYYDPRLSLWLSTDPMELKYPNISTYAYCANNPVIAFDPNGGAVVFINGFFANPIEGGSKNYWRDYDYDVDISWTNIRIHKKINYEFDIEVMKHLKDYNAFYSDGSLGGLSNIRNNTSPTVRKEYGYAIGYHDAKKIINSLKRDSKGNIVEHIKIITHSMGSAYGKGYSSGILQYATDNNIHGVIIDFEADFAPFQPSNQEAVKRPGMGTTYQFSHSDDIVAGNKPINSAIIIDTSNDVDQGHSIGSFINQIKKLPKGDN